MKDGATSVTVSEAWSPKLQVESVCGESQAQRRACEVTAPLAAVRSDGARLYFPSVSGSGYAAINATDVESASLVLRGYDSPNRWRTWGVGFAIAGASGVAGYQIQWRPARWLGFEVGTFAPLVRVPFIAFAAVRLRPVTFGPFAPFTGWFVNTVDDAESSTNISGTGPRFGIELEIYHGRWVLSAEADLAHPQGEDRLYLGGQHGWWVPWGGAGGAYFF